MTDSWQRISLREAGVELWDCDHRTPPATSSGYPYIAIPQLKGGRIDLSGVRRISHEHFKDWTKKTCPQANDVVLSRRCNPGETAVVPQGLDCALGQNLVLLRSNDSKVLPTFLRWLVRGPEWWDQVQKFLNVGAVFDSLKCADIPNFQLSIPSIKDQKAIAHILGTLDDKIELNRKMNETLEAMARAIFKSWFIDFDPVRAKAEGRTPEGMDSGTASLFPQTLTGNGDIELPSGWGRLTLADVTIYLSRGLSPSYVDVGGTLVLNQKCVRGGRVDLTKARRHDPSRRAISGRELREGDVLVNSTGVGTLGRVAQVMALGEVTIVDSHVTVVRANPGVVTWNYLGLDLLGREAEIEALGEGSTGQTELSRARLGQLHVTVPSISVLRVFDDLTLPYRHKVEANDAQSRKLAVLRDTLLPKLLSGEIRIREAEMQLEAVL